MTLNYNLGDCKARKSSKEDKKIENEYKGSIYKSRKEREVKVEVEAKED